MASSLVAQDTELDASLYPIAVLLDELKNEDLNLRLNATKRIKTIAAALGPERTRVELLPFLTESIDDEDEVLLTLAEELGDYLDEIGGPEYAYVLMEALENLSIVEETIVRDKAVASLRKISHDVRTHGGNNSHSDVLHSDHLFPLVQRLATGDWFTSRISACALFAAVYSGLPKSSMDLRNHVINMFKALARDETPMVRRAAASNIGDFTTAVAKEDPEKVDVQLFPVFSALVKDEQDSVRLLVVENAAVFARVSTACTERTNNNNNNTPTPMATTSDAAPPADNTGKDKATGKDEPATATTDEDTLMSSSQSSTVNGVIPDEIKAPTEETSENSGSTVKDSSANDTPDNNMNVNVNSTDSSFRPRTTNESSQIVDMLRGFAVDKSWRVRYMVADQLADMCDALGPKATRNDLLPAYLRLLKDKEPEVRTAAAFKVSDFSKRIVALPAISKDEMDSSNDNTTNNGNSNSNTGTAAATGLELVIRDILPPIQELVGDNSQHVRAALASNIMGMAPDLGVEVTVEHLVDIVLALLKDEYPEVRLNVIAQLDKVSFIMSIEKLSGELLPAIVELAEDKNWRVRLAIIAHIPLLAKQLGKEYFGHEKKLGELCIKWLGDSVCTIREAAITNLKKLTEVFGVEWAQINIVPQVLSLYDMSNNYLLRMTSLNAIGVLSELVGRSIVEDMFLPVVTEKASRDPVPNVRFCSAKTLTVVIPFVGKEMREKKIRPVLMTLVGSETEKDTDVQYFAQQALKTLAACTAA